MIADDDIKGENHDQGPDDRRQHTLPRSADFGSKPTGDSQSNDSQTFTRLPLGFQAPPHDIEAEQALLGAIMINNAALDQPSEYLKPEHFYEPVHRAIFDIMLRLKAEGRLIDHITLGTAFNSDERLVDLNGRQYLAGLARAAECILNAADYARLIFDLAQRRFLGDILQDGMKAAMDPSLSLAADWKDVAHRVTSAIGDISIDEPSDKTWSGTEVIEQLKDQIRARHSKIKTGYRCLDDALGGGLRSGAIYGLNAPPKSQKTTLLSGIQRGVLKAGIRTHFFSLEQAPTDLALRECCGDTGNSLYWMENERNADKVERIIDQWAKDEPYFQEAEFSHVPGITIDDLLVRMNHSIIDHGTKVFFIDYYTKIMGKKGMQSEAAFFELVAQKLAAFIQSTGTVLVIALQQNREGKNLWSDGIKRECSWLATIHKVELRINGFDRTQIWLECTDSRYGRATNVGSEDEQFLYVTYGPSLREL